MTLDEAFNTPYRALLEIAVEDLTLDPHALLGRRATFSLTRDALHRSVHGVVERVESVGATAHHQLVTVTLVPALQALAHRSDCRIYQHKTVPEILQLVLGDGPADWRRPVRMDLVRPRYPRREYCVQYRETHLAFVQRLCAEEGIAFWFEQGEEHESLVFSDANNVFSLVPTLDSEPLAVRATGLDRIPVESLRTFSLRRALHTTKVAVRDFDWTQDELLVVARDNETEGPGGFAAERFEYPAPLTIGDYDRGTHKYTQEDSRAQSTLHRQRHTAQTELAAGAGNVTGLTPGCAFLLRGHLHDDFDAPYLVTQIRHHGCVPDVLRMLAVAHGANEERYGNEFVAQPRSLPYRPPRPDALAKPRIDGVQTARVVGGTGDELFVDEHGRIKVQFHWDRRGQKNEQSSGWVRVAQNYAGKSWGFVFIPRVGMEVLVTFLDGDPDRPLVTGAAYNGEHRPPYELPAHVTRSVIRTQSTKGGQGYNELSFEDMAGHEEVYLRAQRNLRELVRHDHATRVGNDQSLSVGHDQTETVEHDQKIEVHGNQSRVVFHEQTLQVGGNRNALVKGNEEVAIFGYQQVGIRHAHSFSAEKQAVALGGGSADTNGLAAGDHALTVGHDRTTAVRNRDVLHTGESHTRADRVYDLGAGQQIHLHQQDVHFVMQQAGVTLEAAGHKVRVQNAAGVIELDGNRMTLNAVGMLKLACGQSSIELDANGEIKILGALAVKLGVGASTAVQLDAGSVSTSAARIATSAIGLHEIAGALVKIG